MCEPPLFQTHVPQRPATDATSASGDVNGWMACCAPVCSHLDLTAASVAAASACRSGDAASAASWSAAVIGCSTSEGSVVSAATADACDTPNALAIRSAACRCSTRSSTAACAPCKSARTSAAVRGPVACASPAPQKALGSSNTAPTAACATRRAAPACPSAVNADACRVAATCKMHSAACASVAYTPPQESKNGLPALRTLCEPPANDKPWAECELVRLPPAQTTKLLVASLAHEVAASTACTGVEAVRTAARVVAWQLAPDGATTEASEPAAALQAVAA